MNAQGRHIEVEVKAWLDDPELTEKIIAARAQFIRECTYQDTYFTYASSSGYQAQRFRLRQCGDKATITAKLKMQAGDMEINQESEFEVSDAQAFCEFASRFGFRVMIKKTKHLRIYRLQTQQPGVPELSVELVRVEDLGNFVEVEALLSDTAQVNQAKQAVLNAILDLGIPSKNIEPRPYTKMLYDIHNDDENNPAKQ